MQASIQATDKVDTSVELPYTWENERILTPRQNHTIAAEKLEAGSVLCGADGYQAARVEKVERGPKLTIVKLASGIAVTYPSVELVHVITFNC